ncbi:triose-phosphate isomerase [Parvibium lacunae]|uniref:Triosephosphate isomerase n=1 Tax=Parvibium lacunae TaxID=1888893 RepID=A0A368L3S3_9BURK|nr:triose-phosphate isomerase [Parvibium lacunae]RCS58175.1 triose-phosphate isomerase [Parvibium lacunae]
MTQRKKLIAGNWKMNGSLSANQALLSGLVGQSQGLVADVAVCVPFPYLAQAQEVLKDSAVAWGAQTLSEREPGACTGEVAASMLQEFGCRYVIVGHSERRTLFGESSVVVAQKAEHARVSGLCPIICVGETLAERESGATLNVLKSQLEPLRAGLLTSADFVLAYEPVWAIGTGKTASPEQAQEVHAYLRNWLVERAAAISLEAQQRIAGVRILYGGSMKPANAQSLLAQPDIDGGLIGGASLVLEEFLAICRAA